MNPSSPAAIESPKGARKISRVTRSRLEMSARAASIFIPLLALCGVIFLAWGQFAGIVEICLLLAMYAITGIGVTLGFHRLFTHGSYKTSRPLKVLLAIAGSMSAEDPILRWVADHRRHHQHSDRDGDPHSPNAGRIPGFYGAIRGIVYAQFGWFFRPREIDDARYVRDLSRDRDLVIVDRLFLPLVVAGLLIPACAGGILHGSATGFVLGLLWGGLIRMLLVSHITWSINSICHVWGTQPFNSGDESRNNFLCALVSFGEGWHNNHHAFPGSARHGLVWWQFDPSWLLILFMSKLGLFWDLRTPSDAAIAARGSNSVA